MNGERVERRLAAILAADVAGYSRLMGAYEEGTLARLRAHRRELIDPKISEHRGRLVKTTGDGILIEFPSVIEAVSCAVAVQRGMLERNAGTPEEQQIIFRVGVNLGTSLSRTATSTAMASTSLHGWRGSLSLAASASRKTPSARYAAKSRANSQIWASRASRTSLGRCGCTVCLRKDRRRRGHELCRFLTSRRSQYCRWTI
jgi:class 3 adenylate cyclase